MGTTQTTSDDYDLIRLQQRHWDDTGGDTIIIELAALIIMFAHSIDPLTDIWHNYPRLGIIINYRSDELIDANGTLCRIVVGGIKNIKLYSYVCYRVIQQRRSFYLCGREFVTPSTTRFSTHLTVISLPFSRIVELIRITIGYLNRNLTQWWKRIYDLRS